MGVEILAEHLDNLTPRSKGCDDLEIEPRGRIIVEVFGWLSIAAFAAAIGLAAALPWLSSPLRQQRWGRYGKWLVVVGLATPGIGIARALWALVSAGGNSEPSEKSTQLAQAISEGLNCAALALLPLAVLAVATLASRVALRVTRGPR